MTGRGDNITKTLALARNMWYTEACKSFPNMTWRCSAPSNTEDPVAQSVEQLTFNQ